MVHAFHLFQLQIHHPVEFFLLEHALQKLVSYGFNLTLWTFAHLSDSALVYVLLHVGFQALLTEQVLAFLQISRLLFRYLLVTHQTIEIHLFNKVL